MTSPFFRTPKGTSDVLPEDHEYMTYIKKAVRHRARQAGYRRIDPPVFEKKEVFEKSLGVHNPLIQDHLFTFEQEDGEFALRPEFTAGICRSFIEHKMNEHPLPVELYSIGQCFRNEKPQKGRYKQFHQFDFEVIGLKDASLDAQIILVLSKILGDLRVLDRLSLQVNNVGTHENRTAYIEALQDYFIGKERNLPDQDRELLATNPLRLFASKEEDTKILLKSAPTMDQFISEESREYFEVFLSYLDEFELEYTVNPSIVRTADYYNDVVFEYWDTTRNSESAVAGGGRYDKLIEELGGESMPGSGVAVGIERLIWHMKEAGVQPPHKDQVDVFVAQLGPDAKKQCLKLISQLRDIGVHTLGALGEASIKSQLNLADTFGAKYCLLLGQMEVKENKVIFRDMVAGKQKHIAFDKAISEIIKVIGDDHLDTYTLNDHLGKHA